MRLLTGLKDYNLSMYLPDGEFFKGTLKNIITIFDDGQYVAYDNNDASRKVFLCLARKIPYNNKENNNVAGI